jgi:hypothetical protein
VAAAAGLLALAIPAVIEDALDLLGNRAVAHRLRVV